MGERESVKSVWGSGFMGEGGEMALGVGREWSEMEEFVRLGGGAVHSRVVWCSFCPQVRVWS